MTRRIVSAVSAPIRPGTAPARAAGPVGIVDRSGTSRLRSAGTIQDRAGGA
jgi:hypothetical protein